MKALHLDIPFYPSFPTPGHPGGLHCQEMSLKMILGYFLPDRTFTTKELEQITGMKPERAAWEMQFLIWFADHGFAVKHYATFDYEQFQTDGIDYIRNTYGDETAEWQLANSDVAGALSQIPEYLHKVPIVAKKPKIEDIREAMHNGYVVRASINSSFLNGQKGYVGHSVVVTGLDDASIWFHDPGLPALENRQATHEDFQAAMDSFGSEMDSFKLIK